MRKRREARKRWVVIGASVVGLVVICLLVAVALSNQRSSDVGTRLLDEGRTHVDNGTSPRYNHYPPASGPHYTNLAAWGSMGTPLAEGNFVHNLEHGGIALLYNCAEPCDDVVKLIEEVSRSLPPDPRFHEVKFVATPYSHMEHTFAVLAWDYITDMETLDAAYVLKFYNAHLDKGPELAP